MASRDTRLNIIVDAQDRTKRGLDRVNRSLGGIKVDVDKLSGSLRTMGKYGAVAFGALSAASAKLIKNSADSLQIEESYRRMTEQAGISADELLKQLQRTSAGTVSATDLMLASNRAMALGVGEDMETVTQLMEIARLKGRSLGLTTTQAFNDIVTGIGRGSPLILDNLGITIKLGEAQQMYADKLGVTVAELTDAQKKQSLLNAVMTEGNKEVAEAGELQVSAAEKLQTAKAQFADAADTIGRTLIPAATKLLEAITPIIEKVAKWVEKNPELTATLFKVALGGAAVLTALGAIGVILPVVAAGMAALSGPGAIVIGILGALGFAVMKVVKIIELLRTSWRDVWLGIKLVVVDAVNGVIGLVEGLINKIVNGINSFINRINRIMSRASSFTGLDIPKIGTLDTVSLNRVDADAVVSADLARRPSAQQVVVTGNNFLSEDAAEEMGDMIMNRLKLSNAV